MRLAVLLAVSTSVLSQQVVIRPPNSYGAISAPGLRVSRNATLKQAVTWAFNIEPLFVDIPKLLGSIQFDLIVDPKDATRLRDELIRTFSLAYHTESRPLRTLVLRRVEPGPELHAAEIEEAAKNRIMATHTGGSADCRACSIERDLLPILEFSAHVPVIDETGLGAIISFR